MLNKIATFCFLLIASIGFTQKNSENFPVFPNCDGKQAAELETCFYFEVQNFVYQNFKVPVDSQSLKSR